MELPALWDVDEPADWARLQALAAFLADMEQVSAILGCFGAEPGQWLRSRRGEKVLLTVPPAV